MFSSRVLCMAATLTVWLSPYMALVDNVVIFGHVV